jgi:adenosylcobinamide-GDP ribazoletransferase
MLRGAIVAAQFLTRVPLSRRVVETHELSRAVAWFPVVGAFVGGAIAVVIALFTRLLGFDAAIVAGLIFGALLTGAFHEDGLADTCDGVGGGFTRDRALEIMRDSRIGAYGAVAIVLLYAARITLFRALGNPMQILLVLPPAAALARASSAALMIWLPNARKEEGMAGHVARTLGGATVSIALTLATVITVALCGRAAVALVAAAVLVTVVSALYLRHRLGGVTGDCLGAVNVAVEVASVAAAVAWIRSFAPLELLRWP